MAKTANKNEAQAPDFLDEFKQVERAIRAKALAKMLTTLKEKAHEILELKEYTNSVMGELGVEEADQKRLVDWINSLEQVKLSAADKKEIHADAREDVANERKEAEKKVDSAPFIGYMNAGTQSGIGMGTTLTTTTLPTFSTNNNPEILKLKGLPTNRVRAINLVSQTSDNALSSFTMYSGASSLDIGLK